MVIFPKARIFGVAVVTTVLMGTSVSAQDSEPTTPPEYEQFISVERGNITIQQVDGAHIEFDWLVVGSKNDSSETDYIDTEADLEIPELPVIFEDETPEEKTKDKALVEAKEN